MQEFKNHVQPLFKIEDMKSITIKSDEKITPLDLMTNISKLPTTTWLNQEFKEGEEVVLLCQIPSIVKIDPVDLLPNYCFISDDHDSVSALPQFSLTENCIWKVVNVTDNRIAFRSHRGDYLRAPKKGEFINTFHVASGMINNACFRLGYCPYDYPNMGETPMSLCSPDSKDYSMSLFDMGEKMLTQDPKITYFTNRSRLNDADKNNKINSNKGNNDVGNKEFKVKSDTFFILSQDRKEVLICSSKSGFHKLIELCFIYNNSLPSRSERNRRVINVQRLKDIYAKPEFKFMQMPYLVLPHSYYSNNNNKGPLLHTILSDCFSLIENIIFDDLIRLIVEYVLPIVDVGSRVLLSESRRSAIVREITRGDNDVIKITVDNDYGLFRVSNVLSKVTYC